MAAAKQVGDRVIITSGQHKDDVGTLVGKEGRAWQVELEDGEKVLVPFPQVASVESQEADDSTASEPSPVEVESVEVQSEENEPDPVEKSPDTETSNILSPEENVEVIAVECDPTTDGATVHEIQPDGTVKIEFDLDNIPPRGSRAAVVEQQESLPAPEPANATGGQPQDGESVGQTSDEEPLAKTGKTKRSAKRERSIEGIDDSDLTRLSVVQLQALAISKGIGIARTKSNFIEIVMRLEPKTDPDRLKGQFLFDTVSRLHISRLRNKSDFINLLQG